MKSIATKLIIILALAALVPMTILGVLSIWTARKATSQAIAEGNLHVAERAAEQIDLYVTNSFSVLKALAQNISKTDLKDWQRERMIRNYVLTFEEFQEIVLTDTKGRLMATSRLGKGPANLSRDPAFQIAIRGEVYTSEVFISENFVPTMRVAVPLLRLNRIEGALMGQVNLTAMWTLVDSIRIGQEGYAFVASASGLLIAHGSGEAKGRVIRQEKVGHLPIVKEALVGHKKVAVYRDERGSEEIGVAVPISSLGWALVIEQPTREAYAVAQRMTRQLAILIGFFFVLVAVIGCLGGRRQVLEPIRRLIQGIRVISNGNLEGKVIISTGDEFQELGEAFNRMTGKLKGLQEEALRNERTVFLGRVAASLVHDLKHPIQNIENSSKVFLRRFHDKKCREVFKRITEREFDRVKRFLEDLQNLASSPILQPILLDLEKTLSDCIEVFGGEAKKSRIKIILDLAPEDLKIRGDKFAVERVFKNLIRNAIEAMPEGGALRVSAMREKDDLSGRDFILIAFSDTGPGVPKEVMGSLFTGYTTTKRRGLGLGLAISKKIMEELQGTIALETEEGKGSVFTVRFPLA